MRSKKRRHCCYINKSTLVRGYNERCMGTKPATATRKKSSRHSLVASSLVGILRPLSITTLTTWTKEKYLCHASHLRQYRPGAADFTDSSTSLEEANLSRPRLCSHLVLNAPRVSLSFYSYEHFRWCRTSHRNVMDRALHRIRSDGSKNLAHTAGQAVVTYTCR